MPEPDNKPSVILGVFGGLCLFFIGIPAAIFLLPIVFALLPYLVVIAVVACLIYLCLTNHREIISKIFSSKFETCECQCGQHVEYPKHARGTEINCPSCGQKLLCIPSK
jgi:ABC-type protease/lipase transport system fused ATPase/permease subunit